MNHLSQAELIDFVEDPAALPAERARHASSCQTCREAADDVRAALGLAAADEVPAPSPLYWDRLSSRIGDAVRDEPAPRSQGHGRWGWAVGTWGAATTATALLALMIILRATVHAPVPAGPPDARSTPGTPAAPVSAAIVPVEPVLNADDDEAWAVVRAAADDLGWEEAHAAGLAARPGSAEGIALELTAEERIELGRLLGPELKRNGA